MPNWCYTRYAIESMNTKEIETLKAKLDELSAMNEPMWIGCIVELLGEKWNSIRCRGQIIEYYIDSGALRLTVESAWSELNEVRALFLSKHPDCKIYYMSEECGMGIFDTNDSSGRYFSERYVVDSEEKGAEYFDDLGDVADYISELTGKEIDEVSLESIEKAIDEWESEEEDRWISFNEFSIVED